MSVLGHKLHHSPLLGDAVSKEEEVWEAGEAVVVASEVSRSYGRVPFAGVDTGFKVARQQRSQSSSGYTK
jgi:hypothetical protein